VPVIHETVTAKKEEQKEKTAEEKIAELNLQMQKAIEEQNFEQAAVLRDEIKSLKGEN
jgi:protein-arginine kinase activator protein McsA